MAVRIQLRRDTATEWTNKNPVLAEGEIGLEKDTAKLKIGDGATTWAALDYHGDGPAGAVTSVNGQTGVVELNAGHVGADPTGTAAAAVATHVAAPDPHGQYALESMLGSAAAWNVPSSGNAATNEVVKGSDTRLTNARTPTAHNHPANEISDSTTAGRALLTAADAAAQRAALALSTLAASVFYPAPVNGSLTVSAKAAFSMTLNQIRGLKLAAGSCTLSVQINGTNVTGLSGLSVTTTPQDVSATAANAVAVGDRITIVIASAVSAANLECTLSATR